MLIDDEPRALVVTRKEGRRRRITTTTTYHLNDKSGEKGRRRNDVAVLTNSGGKMPFALFPRGGSFSGGVAALSLQDVLTGCPKTDGVLVSTRILFSSSLPFDDNSNVSLACPSAISRRPTNPTSRLHSSRITRAKDPPSLFRLSLDRLGSSSIRRAVDYPSLRRGGRGRAAGAFGPRCTTDECADAYFPTTEQPVLIFHPRGA